MLVLGEVLEVLQIVKLSLILFLRSPETLPFFFSGPLHLSKKDIPTRVLLHAHLILPCIKNIC